MTPGSRLSAIPLFGRSEPGEPSSGAGLGAGGSRVAAVQGECGAGGRGVPVYRVVWGAYAWYVHGCMDRWVYGQKQRQSDFAARG